MWSKKDQYRSRRIEAFSKKGIRKKLAEKHVCRSLFCHIYFAEHLQMVATANTFNLDFRNELLLSVGIIHLLRSQNFPKN